eukprot:jgi/Chrzof1/13271/Cz07g27020.t1
MSDINNQVVQWFPIWCLPPLLLTCRKQAVLIEVGAPQVPGLAYAIVDAMQKDMHQLLQAKLSAQVDLQLHVAGLGNLTSNSTGYRHGSMAGSGVLAPHTSDHEQTGQHCISQLQQQRAADEEEINRLYALLSTMQPGSSDVKQPSTSSLHHAIYYQLLGLAQLQQAIEVTGQDRACTRGLKQAFQDVNGLVCWTCMSLYAPPTVL